MLGWVITYCFAIGWLRMIQIFMKKFKKKRMYRIRPKSKEEKARIAAEEKAKSHVSLY